jgi:4a-hydroxytetrahydrobiopterin dehydratase
MADISGQASGETLTPEEFMGAAGVEDWRADAAGATAVFATGSFATGVALVDEIGRLADAAGHHPDVDLRYPSVTVHLITHDAGDALTEKDVSMAREITGAAAELGIDADRASGTG